MTPVQVLSGFQEPQDITRDSGEGPRLESGRAYDLRFRAERGGDKDDATIDELQMRLARLRGETPAVDS